jgi:RNA polymerase sigma-70 factor (ECF subfamily)
VLFRTALNLASNRRRSLRLWRFVGFADAVDELPFAARADTIVPRNVQAALQALPDDLRRVLLLTELAGMTYAEVAMTLHIREGTVGSRRTRALEMLRRDLGIEGGLDT